MTTEAQIYALGSYANRSNTPKAHRPTNKPPNQPKLSTNYDSIMQNKPNLLNAQMNVNKVLTKDYESQTLGGRGKNKPNTKPIQTQSNPKQTQFQTRRLTLQY